MDWFKITWAIVLAFFIWRIIPIASHAIKHGTKGTSKDWVTTALLLGGVVLFVVFLIGLVRA